MPRMARPHRRKYTVALGRSSVAAISVTKVAPEVDQLVNRRLGVAAARREANRP